MSTRRPVARMPRLKREGTSWVGNVMLSSWSGFQQRRGPYGSISPRRKRPTIQIDFQPCGKDEQAQRRPSPEQIAAYSYLVAHESSVTRAVLARILRAYPRLRATYHKDYDIDAREKRVYADELDELFDDLRPLPVIKRARDLRRVMGVAWIHVLDVAKDGLAYIGFELGCSWDDEHGAGVMTHKARVVDFGYADTSFLDWIAEKDGGKRIVPNDDRAR